MGYGHLILTVTFACVLISTAYGQLIAEEHRSEMVKFKSTIDGSMQPAIIHFPINEQDEPVPLLVMLHTWGSSFATNYSAECLAECKRNGWDWAMIEPYYRGPNDQPEACASELAVQDVLDAIEYMKTRVKIDPNRVYTAGISGGGHMAMTLAGRAPHVWAGVSAWVGQADLASWYQEMKAWPDPVFWHYWINLEAICGAPPGTSPEIDEQYRFRSPLTHLSNARGVAIDINAGIDDGHTGCVPISHSLKAFNVLAEVNGQPQKN
jgi:pimeloyl-ACP methyl ester carboxylesterase